MGDDTISDEERPFAGDTASFYARFRRAYPAEFVARLSEFGGCWGRNRLLDLGCGTGILSLQLAPFFDRVVGIDPEPDMLREAEKAAREQGLGNVEWVRGSSAELQAVAPALGSLVTIGTAFHYMEPHATLGELQRIAAKGAVAVAYNGSPMWLHPDPWAKALRSVLESRLGQLADDTDFTAEALQAAERTMRDLGYTEIERWERIEIHPIDVDFVVGHILSATSADQIPPTERERFAQDVSSAIHSAAPAAQLVETVRVRAVIGCTD